MSGDESKSWERLREDVKEPLQKLREELNEVFDEHFSPRGADPRMAIHRRFCTFSPRIDLVETETAYVLTAEVPGMDAAAIEVTADEQGLLLRGEKPESDTEDEVIFRERLAGRFKRTVPLDKEIQTDQVEAKASDGLLIVTAPKVDAGQGRGRRVEIKVGE